MAKFNYDFNLTPHNGKRRPDQWSRRMRLTVLFCIVAAVTAAVIYALVPKKNIQTVPHPAPPASDSERIASSAAEVDAPLPPVTESAPVSDPAPQVTVEEDPAAPAITPQEENNQVQEEMPEKGQISPSDPKAADDMPVTTGERVPELENSLNALLQEQNYEKLFSEADRAIAATTPDSAVRAELGKILTAGRKTLWQKGNWQYIASTHKVVSGDNLSTLARRNHTTVNLLKKANNLKNSNIMIGQQLKIISGPWKVVICKKARLMTLLRQVDKKDTVFAVFAIGIGRKNSTPSGKFVICHRNYHPVYRDNQGRIFKYGHKNNPLGECFLALARPESPAKPFRGYGIHGTADDASVGRSLSNGCIRMHNEDVLMLYNLLPAGTTVEITE